MPHYFTVISKKFSYTEKYLTTDLCLALKNDHILLVNYDDNHEFSLHTAVYQGLRKLGLFSFSSTYIG